MYYFEKVAKNVDKESNKDKVQTALGTAMIGNSIKRGKNQLEKKASMYLDEMYKEASSKTESKYKHKYKIPLHYDVYNIQEEIDWHNNFYEEEGINAPKFNEKLFPIAGNGLGDSIVVDRRNGKETLRFFWHEDPEGEMDELGEAEKIDFGLAKFKPSELQQKLINNNILSEEAVENLDENELKQYVDFGVKKKPLKEKVVSALSPTVYGGTFGMLGAGFLPQEKITPRLVGKTTATGAAIGTGLGIAYHISNKKTQNEEKKRAMNNARRNLRYEVQELNHRGYKPTKIHK